MTERTPITEEAIEAKRTAAGGWTRDVLNQWGVPWPPPKGWKKELVASGTPYPTPIQSETA